MNRSMLVLFLFFAFVSTLGTSVPSFASDPDGSIAAMADDLHALAKRTAADVGQTLPAGDGIRVVTDGGTDTVGLACNGWWDCAWLRYFCSVAGGITGFDNECYLPSENDSAEKTLGDFRALVPELARLEQLDPARREAERRALVPTFDALARSMVETVKIHTDLLDVDRGPDAGIACDPFWSTCTCNGAIDCAWLGWFCAAAGGITGFDDECHLPSTVDGAPGVGQTIQARFPTLDRPFGGLRPVENGFVVELPADVAADLPVGRKANLTLRHPERGETSVVGMMVADESGVRIETSDIFTFPVDDPRIEIDVTDGTQAIGGSCGHQWLPGCWITFCAGTRYCLPGPGPGGFVCECI